MDVKVIYIKNLGFEESVDFVWNDWGVDMLKGVGNMIFCVICVCYGWFM